MKTTTNPHFLQSAIHHVIADQLSSMYYDEIHDLQGDGYDSELEVCNKWDRHTQQYDWLHLKDQMCWFVLGTIKEASKETYLEIAKQLKDNFKLTGIDDESGEDVFCDIRGKEKAEKVVEWLVQQYPAFVGRIKPVGDSDEWSLWGSDTDTPEDFLKSFDIKIDISQYELSDPSLTGEARVRGIIEKFHQV